MPHVLSAESWRRVLAIPRRKWLVAGGGVAAALVLGLAAFGPIVRARIDKEAERRQLEVAVGSVRPGFFSVVLGDVRVKPRGVPGIEAKLDDVRVELSAGFSVREVQARGGEIRIEGEPEDVASRLRDLRARGGTATSGGSEHGSRVALDVDGIGLAWKVPSGGDVHGTGLRVQRNADATKLGCAKCSASHRHVTIEIDGADAELAPDGAPRRLAANAVRVVYEPPREQATPGANASATANEPAPPPLPSLVKRAGKAATPTKAAAAQAVVEPEEPVLPLPDLHALRARIAALTTTIGARVADGTTVDVGGLAAKLDVGGEPVALGPGAFTLARHADVIKVTFVTEKAAAGTPLSIDAELPLGAGDVTARLSGGPVPLALLGVKEGTKGLFDVNRGTVSGKGQLVLAAKGDALTYDGQLALRSISIKNPRVSTEPVRDLELDVSGRGLLDDRGRLRIDDAQLDMKAIHLRAHGTIEETKDHFGVSLSMDVPPAACQALLESTPAGLLPTIRSARMSGTFGATARVVFDTRAIDKLELDYRIDDQCKVTEVTRDLSRDRFSSEFTYRTYHPDGTPSETTTGPGTPSWTNLDDISPFMVAAVLTTEDGAFYKHHGFNHYAIRSSVQANLKARRFVRGASTITMQLAKNLFLSREKTLSRKIEEVVLTDYLEQAFRKDDMMELYLNVVEFGPDVYGVTQAADYYFGRRPDELNLAECLLLATLLPAPVRYGKMREKGEPSEAWMRHIQTLMTIAEKNGKITKAELAEGLTQKIVFVKEGAPKPEPRRPIPNPRRDPYGADEGWQPLD